MNMQKDDTKEYDIISINNILENRAQNQEQNITIIAPEFMDGIPNGIITEQNLVSVFSSDRVYDKYFRVGHFTGLNKKNTLDYAANFCTVNPLPKRMYEITESFAPYIPFELRLLKNGIYNYITPLILKALTDNASARGLDVQICKSVINLAHEIKMVNNNYLAINRLKRQYAEWEKELGQVHLYLVKDYFMKVWPQIKYYLTSCLDKLVEAGLITYDMPYMVTVLNENSEKEYRPANERDMLLRRSCQLVVLKSLDKETLGDFKKDDYACNHGKDRTIYNWLLNKELRKNNILSFFLCYRINLVPDKLSTCVKLRNSYSKVGDGSDIGDSEFIDSFNRSFYDIIINSVKNRTDKSRVDPLTFDNGWGDYRMTYRRLAEITLFDSAAEIEGLGRAGEDDKIYTDEVEDEEPVEIYKMDSGGDKDKHDKNIA